MKKLKAYRENSTVIPSFSEFPSYIERAHMKIFNTNLYGKIRKWVSRFILKIANVKDQTEKYQILTFIVTNVLRIRRPVGQDEKRLSSTIIKCTSRN